MGATAGNAPKIASASQGEALAAPHATSEEPQPQTPSKFGSIFERLKAKERGEDVGSGWTPRQSPLRSQFQPWKTPPRGVARSPAAFQHASTSQSSTVPAAPSPCSARLVATKLEPGANAHDNISASPAASVTPRQQKLSVK